MSQSEGALKFFLDALTNENLSHVTITCYISDVKTFLETFNPDKRLNSFTREDINKYIRSSLTGQKNTSNKKHNPKTINRRIKAVRKFFNFLVQNKSVKENPCQYTRPLSEPKDLPRVLTRGEVQDLLSRIPKNRSMDKIILKFIYQTGLRISEALNLKIEDIDSTQNKIRVRGKGNKERVLPVDPAFLKPLYSITPDGQAFHTRALVFYQRDGKPILPNSLYTRFQKYAESAKINATIHTLRHSFATHMLEDGFPLVYIQEYLGHSNINTTRIYTHIANPEMLRQYKKHSKTLA